MYAVGSKIFVSYHSPIERIEFIKSAGEIFARVVLDGLTMRCALDDSYMAIQAIPINLQLSSSKTIKWLLNNQYFPRLDNKKIVFVAKTSDKKEEVSFNDFFPNFACRVTLDTDDPDVLMQYESSLIKAKEHHFVEEQIYYAFRLSQFYIQMNHWLTGAKILNCAVAIASNHLTIKNYLLFQLENLEDEFLKTQGIISSIKRTKTIVDYRDSLLSCREAARYSEASIEETLSLLTQGLKSILSELIFEIITLLGPPPTKWACVGMGSMSREEMCPYSDLEFAFLIEEDHLEAKEYFRMLSKILELKIINLGETEFPLFEKIDFATSPTPNGFCMDSGGNTPIGGVHELIDTPIRLAQLQRVDRKKDTVILSNAMSHVTLIIGNEDLLSEYIKAKEEVQDLKGEADVDNREQLVMKLLEGHLKEFRPKLFQREVPETFGIKKELYRPFQENISCLAMFYKLKAKTTLGRIDELQQMGIFSVKGAENLKNAVSQVFTLRLQAHLFYQNEEEKLHHPPIGQNLDSTLLYINDLHIKSLYTIYQVLLPFYKCMDEFYKKRDTEVFNNQNFYDDGPIVSGKTHEMIGKHLQAIEIYQQALDPSNSDLILILGSVNLRLGDIRNIDFELTGEGNKQVGNYKLAASRFLQALDVLVQKYGENHSDIAKCLYGLGMIHQKFENHKSALKELKNCLAIQSQDLEVNHIDIARTLYSMGLSYHNLQKNDKACQFLNRSLRIQLKVLSKENLELAYIYSALGNVYKALGKLIMAFDYHQKSLETALCCLKKDSLSLAIFYQNMSSAYADLGIPDECFHFCAMSSRTRNAALGRSVQQESFWDNLFLPSSTFKNALTYLDMGMHFKEYAQFDKAIECFRKALRICFQHALFNHPAVGSCYNNLGIVYEALGNHTIALQYHQKALKIFIGTSGNPFLIAKSYHNIGCSYNNLLNYEEGIKYCLKALDIRLENGEDNHSEIATNYDSIGIAYSKLGKVEKGFEYCQRALNIREGEPSIDLATSYTNMAHLYLMRKDAQLALKFHQKALEILVHFFGETHPDVIESHINIAFIYDEHLKEHEKAIKICQNALDMELKFCRESHNFVDVIYLNLASAYAHVGENKKAISFYKKALEICLRKKGQHHPDLIPIYRNMTELYTMQQKHHNAALCYENMQKIA